jgi:hypothetical protein
MIIAFNYNFKKSFNYFCSFFLFPVKINLKNVNESISNSTLADFRLNHMYWK